MSIERLKEKFHSRLEAYKFDPSNKKQNWRGKVTVYWVDPKSNERESSIHHIEILLLDGFPFRAPVIISRDSPPLAKSYHLNQGEYPTLCLWESSSAWQPENSADQLLDRVKEWYRCYHTDKWPQNSYLPDLQNYLPSVATVLIGNQWQPKSSKDISSSNNNSFNEFILWCSKKGFDSGVNVAIASTKLNEDLEHRLKTHNSKKFNAKKGVLFNLTQPVIPNENIEKLLQNIDLSLGAKEGTALKQVSKIIKGRIKGDGFPIAITYPDYSGEDRYLFLWIEFPNKNHRGNKFNPLTASNLKRVKVKSMITAPATSQAMIKRTQHISQHLTNKKVVIFGVGSIGSSVSILLAKAGVNNLSFVDSDVIMPGNVVRHAAGFFYVGYKKTAALKVEIGGYNLDCKIDLFDKTWDKLKIEEIINHADLVIDTTGDLNFSQYLNGICLKNEVVFLHGAAYRRAKIGRILINRSNEDPCLTCYFQNLEIWDNNQFPIIPLNSDDQFFEDGCTSFTEEGAAIDTDLVANFIARTSIQLLRGDFSGSNIGIIVNSSLEDSDNPLFNDAGIRWWRNDKVPPEGITCSCYGS